LSGVSIERCKKNNVTANLLLRNSIKVDPFCGIKIWLLKYLYDYQVEMLTPS